MSAEVKFHDALRTRTFVEYVLVRLANVPKADCEGFLTVMRNEMPCLHDSVLVLSWCNRRGKLEVCQAC